MSNNIIKFPANTKRRKNINNVLIDRITDSHHHIDIGHVPFTCPECKNKSSFDFTNVVFKMIVFYCSHCGHGYQVSNPMFSTTIVSSKLK